MSTTNTVAVNIHAVSALLKPALTAAATVCSGAGVGSVCAKAAEEKDAKRKKSRLVNIEIPVEIFINIVAIFWFIRSALKKYFVLLFRGANPWRPHVFGA
jgi:hypothetical protein